MSTVTVCENIFDETTWVAYPIATTVTDVLTSLYATFPDTARLYITSVDDTHDVTPHTENDVKALELMEGDFWLMVYPETGIEIAIIVAIALAAVSIGLTFLLRPSQPKGQQSQSPNNNLSDRTNKARPNERIADIFGTVRSTPDLIQQPYRIFQNNVEVEHSYMCIGRGFYSILDCKDETTDIANIDGAYAAVFAPNTSPNSTTVSPQVTFGTAPAAIPKIVSIKSSNAVTGQVLRAPNSGTLNAKDNVNFIYPNAIGNNGSISFLDYFAVGPVGSPNFITLDNNALATDPGGSVSSVHLPGTYQILAVTASQLTLVTPASVNANWNTINSFSGSQSTYQHQFSIVTTGSQWVGPYQVPIATLSEIWVNVVAAQGLYYVDSAGNHREIDVTIKIGVQRIDVTGAAIGDEIFGTVNIFGSRVITSQRGATLKFVLPTVGPVQVRAVRVTDMGTSQSNSYVEEIQWRDLFAVQTVTATDFGDVTTVQTITVPTQDALSVKERKLNLLVTRKIPTWNNRATGFLLSSGTVPTFSTTLYPSNNAADIICAMALDPAIGRRTIAELAVQQIYSVADSTAVTAPTGHENGMIALYFGTPLMTEFCYTFDDIAMSFEESLGQLCAAIGCTAYRQGSQIFLNFEKKTANATLLFNHRNKLPNTETRTVSFGTLNDNDGIEYSFVDPNAPNYPNVDTTTTLYFPTNMSAQNPKQITSVGVRNSTQAKINGWRLFQKLMNQNTQVEFDALNEAALIPEMTPVMITDNTRPDVQDGEILTVSGLNLITSQPVVFVGGVTYTCFLQLANGTVQAIGCTAGTAPADPRQGSIILASAPSISLVTDPNQAVRTLYQIVGSTNTQANQFLLNAKEAKENNTYAVTAMNYSDNYYSHDTDVTTGAIVPTPYGYGPQGYTGSGNLTPAGVPYTGGTYTGFNVTTYNASALAIANNVPSGSSHAISPGGYYGPDPMIPAASITGLAASATTDTTNASNIGAGTLPLARIPTLTTTQLPAALARLALPVRTVTAATTLLSNDYAIKANATSGAFTLTLPTPTDDMVLNIKKIDSSTNAVTIAGTIDGGSSLVLTAPNASFNLQYDIVTSSWGVY